MATCSWTAPMACLVWRSRAARTRRSWATRRLPQAHPGIWRRLAQAHPIGEVRGMRDIGNLYRQASGPGWALVGDALHQKDPLDGQGIYDAVFTAKALGQALAAWQHGAVSWEAALAQYEAAVQAETFPMY